MSKNTFFPNNTRLAPINEEVEEHVALRNQENQEPSERQTVKIEDQVPPFQPLSLVQNQENQRPSDAPLPGHFPPQGVQFPMTHPVPNFQMRLLGIFPGYEPMFNIPPGFQAFIRENMTQALPLVYGLPGFPVPQQPQVLNVHRELEDLAPKQRNLSPVIESPQALAHSRNQKIDDNAVPTSDASTVINEEPEQLQKKTQEPQELDVNQEIESTTEQQGFEDCQDTAEQEELLYPSSQEVDDLAKQMGGDSSVISSFSLQERQEVNVSSKPEEPQNRSATESPGLEIRTPQREELNENPEPERVSESPSLGDETSLISQHESLLKAVLERFPNPSKQQIDELAVQVNVAPSVIRAFFQLQKMRTDIMFTTEQESRLKAVLKKLPYPSKSQTKDIAEQMGLELSVVSTFFRLQIRIEGPKEQERGERQKLSKPLNENPEDLLNLPLRDKDIVLTKNLIRRVAAEIAFRHLSKATFAKTVCARSEGVISNILKNPKEPMSIEHVGNTYRQLLNWAELCDEDKMAVIKGEKTKCCEFKAPEPSVKLESRPFTPEERQVLRVEFEKNCYPDDQTVSKFSKQMNVKRCKIREYFKNLRKRQAKKAQ